MESMNIIYSDSKVFVTYIIMSSLKLKVFHHHSATSGIHTVGCNYGYGH